MTIQPGTKVWLDQKIGILNALTGNGMDWCWDKNVQGFQLERAGGTIRVSFRYKHFKPFKDFVEAYIDGIFMGRDAKALELSRDAWKPDWTAADRAKTKIDEATVAREELANRVWPEYGPAATAPVPAAFRRNDAPDRLIAEPGTMKMRTRSDVQPPVGLEEE